MMSVKPLRHLKGAEVEQKSERLSGRTSSCTSCGLYRRLSLGCACAPTGYTLMRMPANGARAVTQGQAHNAMLATAFNSTRGGINAVVIY